MDYLPPPQPPPLPVPPDNNRPFATATTGSPKKDQPKKFSEEEVNRHLMELNGLTRKTQNQRRVVDRGHSSSSSSSSSHISQSPTPLPSGQSGVGTAHLSTNTHQSHHQHHEESNSSISHILSSVLNDSHCPTQVFY